MHTDEKSVLCVNTHTIDVTVQYTGLSLDRQVSISHTYVHVHVPISWMDLGQATSAAVHNYSYNRVSLVPRPFYQTENRPAKKGLLGK